MVHENLVVHRLRSKEDRRVVYIRLTPKGRKLAQGINVEPMEILERARRPTSASEVRELVKILGKVAKKVRQQVDLNEVKPWTAW